MKSINCIHDSKVNNISECNLLHDIPNPFYCTKNININCSHILHGCMNTRKGKDRFNNFRILLDIGCSPTVAMRRLITEQYLNLKLCDKMAYTSGKYYYRFES